MDAESRADDVVTRASTSSPWSAHGLSKVCSGVFSVFFRPANLFRTLSDRSLFGPALVILLVLISLLTQLRIATGVSDYEIDRWTELQIAKIAELGHGTTPEGQLEDQLQSLDRSRSFWKFLSHLEQWAAGPLLTFVSILVIGSLLYALVAISGGKANTQILLSIVVLSNYVEVPRMLLEVVLIKLTGVTRVETSAAAFVSPPEVSVYVYAVLRQFDPFSIWFWVLVAIGLHESKQTSLKGALGIVTFLGLFGAFWSFGWDLAGLVDFFATSPG